LGAEDPVIYVSGRFQNPVDRPDWLPGATGTYYHGIDGVLAGLAPAPYSGPVKKGKNVRSGAGAWTWCTGLATDISDDGYVSGMVNVWSKRAGAGEKPQLESLAVIWHTGTTRILPTPSGFHRAAAICVDDSGMAAGFVLSRPAGQADAVHQAVVWRDGKAELLGTLPGYDQSQAVSINESGQILCMAERGGFNASANFTAISYSPYFATSYVYQGGAVTRIADAKSTASVGIDMSKSTKPRCISASGDVVGQAVNLNGDNVGFLWKGGTIIDLNRLIPSDVKWHIDDAVGINAAGQIACNGTEAGKTHALLLTPTTGAE
jgi:probable HAF family extracellular repeat protein